MHPAAKRCVQWSVGLLVLGTLTLVFRPEVYTVFSRLAGPESEIGYTLLNTAFTFAQATLFPVGSALIGAAVVIQVLGGQVRRPWESADQDRNRNA